MLLIILANNGASKPGEWDPVILMYLDAVN